MIEAIKKLRQYAPNSVPGVRSELLLIADEIQAEIDARYMELPVDADGVPIHVGDMVNARDWRETRKVSEIAVVCETSDGCRFWHMPNNLYHCTRTVEDVLMDVLRDSTHPDMGNSDIIEKYAAELRMAGDA